MPSVVASLLIGLLAAAGASFFPVAKATTKQAPLVRTETIRKQPDLPSSSLSQFKLVTWSFAESTTKTNQSSLQTPTPQQSNQSFSKLFSTFLTPFTSISATPRKQAGPTNKQSLPLEQFYGRTKLISGNVSGPQNYSPTGPAWTNAHVTAYWPGGGPVESLSQTPQYDRNGIPFYTEALGGRVVTAEDYRNYLTGDPNYSFASVGVTAAAYINNARGYDTGVPSYRGSAYVIPEYTYTNARGETYTIENMPVVVRDQGSAFRITGLESEAARADKLNPNSPNYIYNKIDIATDLGSSEHPGSQLDRGRNNRSQVQLVPTNNVGGAGSRVTSTGGNGSGDGSTISGWSRGSGTSGGRIAQLSGSAGDYPADVGAWVERDQENICYKHMGSAGRSSQYDNVETCNSGYRWNEDRDSPIYVEKCGKRATGAGGMTENRCEDSATFAAGKSPLYACLWLACKSGDNAIWDNETKRCGCDDGKGDVNLATAGGDDYSGGEKYPEDGSGTGTPPPDTNLSGSDNADKLNNFNEEQKKAGTDARVVVKEGEKAARIDNLSPVAMDRAAALASACNCTVEITSGTDGVHRTHFAGGVNFDINTSRHPGALEYVRKNGRRYVLDPDGKNVAYVIGDVEYLHEAIDTSNEHIHIQNSQSRRPGAN